MRVLALLTVLLFPSSTLAQDFDTPVVVPGVVCPWGVMDQVIEELKVGPKPPPTGCFRWQFPMPILQVVSGPFHDFEEEEFYVVQVSETHYAIAWPGHNSNLSKRRGSI